MRLAIRFAVCLALMITTSRGLMAQNRAPDGAALYQQYCSSCHDNGAARAPDREQLRAMLPARVLDALETGQMISMATGRSAVERRAIAEFVTGKTLADAPPSTPTAQAMCAGARHTCG